MVSVWQVANKNLPLRSTLIVGAITLDFSLGGNGDPVMGVSAPFNSLSRYPIIFLGVETYTNQPPGSVVTEFAPAPTGYSGSALEPFGFFRIPPAAMLNS